jgi:hypothetical protein
LGAGIAQLVELSPEASPDYPAISGDVIVWEVDHDRTKTGIDIYGYRLPETAGTE